MRAKQIFRTSRGKFGKLICVFSLRQHVNIAIVILRGKDLLLKAKCKRFLIVQKGLWSLWKINSHLICAVKLLETLKDIQVDVILNHERDEIVFQRKST